MAAGPQWKEAAVRHVKLAMVTALVALGLVGCGRTPFEAAPAPAAQLVMEAVEASGEAATLTVTDGGTDAFVDLNGTGFAPDRTYTAAVADLASGFPEIVPQGFVDLTASGQPMAIRPDGSTYFFGSFSIRDLNPSWDAIVVLWHPDGDPTLNRNERVVLRAPLPDRFRP